MDVYNCGSSLNTHYNLGNTAPQSCSFTGYAEPHFAFKCYTIEENIQPDWERGLGEGGVVSQKALNPSQLNRDRTRPSLNLKRELKVPVPTLMFTNVEQPKPATLHINTEPTL